VLYPADLDDLAAFLRQRPADVAVTAIGAGSNLLVRDGGVPGVVVRLNPGFTEVRIDEVEVVAGAGAMDVNVARAAERAGLAGLEFLSGIPGTMGGALRMNAGAYGREIADVAVSATALDPEGGRHLLEGDDFGFGYRHSSVPEGWIFTEVRVRGVRGSRREIAERMAEIRAARTETQPIKARTGGSTFMNPASAEAKGRSAWELVDAAGCRGLRLGGAVVSEQHCNFLVNTGAATAADIEALGEEIRRRVAETAGVALEWEIRRIGCHVGPAATEVGGDG
jgi:UDP-N-acetylmuramate dehydrogenase